MISLAKRCLTQCDVQVSKLNRFAFALAEVCVRVAVAGAYTRPLFSSTLAYYVGYAGCMISPQSIRQGDTGRCELKGLGGAEKWTSVSPWAVVEPLFGVVLVALLHEACVLSVPKYYPFVEARYASDAEYFKLMVGRCRLTVSKHGLKARLVSALETKV